MVLKKKENREIVSKLLKSLFIFVILFAVLIHKTTINSEGFYSVNEVNSSLLEEEERGTVLAVQDDFLYLFVSNSTQEGFFADSIQIVDVQQPENPIIMGKYDLDIDDFIVDFKIKNNIAYILRQNFFSGAIDWTVTLLNITNPSNPVE